MTEAQNIKAGDVAHDGHEGLTMPLAERRVVFYTRGPTGPTSVAQTKNATINPSRKEPNMVVRSGPARVERLRSLSPCRRPSPGNVTNATKSRGCASLLANSPTINNTAARNG